MDNAIQMRLGENYAGQIIIKKYLGPRVGGGMEIRRVKASIRLAQLARR